MSDDTGHKNFNYPLFMLYFTHLSLIKMLPKKLFFLLVILLPFTLSAQSVDDVIKKYLTSIGGKGNWKKVQTLKTSGQYDYGGIKFPFTTFAKSPDHYKFVVTSDGKYYAQSFDGEKGWRFDGFKNETSPAQLTGNAAQAMANEADVALEDIFFNYKKNGHTATLEGKEIIDGKNCFVVKLVRKNGEIETYYIEDQTFELVMKVAKSKNMELQGAILNIAYSDYRKIDGIKIPFKSVSKSNDQVILEVLIEKAEVNTPIDDQEFQFNGDTGK